MPSHITLKRTLLDLQPTGTRRICVNSILPHPRAGRHEVLRYSASPQRFGANSHDHQECNTLGRWRRLPDHDLDLVVSTRADGRRHRTRKLLAPARRLRPAVRPLCRARPLLAPASPLWPSAGRYGPAPGSYTPQSQYVPPPAGTQVITNGPQTNPGDVSPSGERTLRQAAQGKPGVPPGAYAQGMRPDHRSAATSAVPRQLCSILALRR